MDYLELLAQLKAKQAELAEIGNVNHLAFSDDAEDQSDAYELIAYKGELREEIAQIRAAIAEHHSVSGHNE